MKGSVAGDKGQQTREPPYGSIEEANGGGGYWGVDKGHTEQTSAIQKHIARAQSICRSRLRGV